MRRAFARRCHAGWLAALLVCGCPWVAARPLDEVQTSKQLSLCANPNALPYAAERGDLPGFQIEIARALAQRMGLQLQVMWIVPRYRASTVDCDMLMDTILSPGVEQRGLRPSMPYQVGGVGLVFAPGQPTVPDYKSLREGMRVGVMMNSLASLVVSRTAAAMVPFGFEEDMMEAVARGDVNAGAVSPASAGYYNLRHPGQALTVVRAQDNEPELRWNVAVGLRRADDALVEAVNVALKTLLDDGTIRTIYARYGIEHRRP
ncbi:MAG TPA: transporter substrate-binding domain-containing protein [Burkholderiaceae bacterium]|nr:transporter substrate-binding domain-containing protein [Burkholderiaceae bacterium]